MTHPTFLKQKAARAKIEASLGKWSSQIVSKSDDEALEKKIRFLLNLLTPDNYEKVKVDIRDAAQTRYILNAIYSKFC